MTTTIRKSVRPELAEKIPALLQTALVWMKHKYNTVDFEKVDFIFSASYRGSTYYRNSNNEKYERPVCAIHTGATMLLYFKPSLGMKKKRGANHCEAFTGSEINIVSAVIHELTHHVQKEQGLGGGEIMTTANELEYLKQFHPVIFNKFSVEQVPVETQAPVQEEVLQVQSTSEEQKVQHVQEKAATDTSELLLLLQEARLTVMNLSQIIEQLTEKMN